MIMRSVPSKNSLSGTLKAVLLYFIIICIPFLTFSQVSEPVLKKLSLTLQGQLQFKQQDRFSTFVIAVSEPSLFKAFLGKTPGIFTMYEYEPANIFLVTARWKDLFGKILPRPEVLFIDEQRIPKEEVAVSNLDISTNKVNMVHARFPQYNGQALTVSVKENRPDTADIDFKGRYVSTHLSSATLSSHATIMATIIAGAGNTYYEGKGVAVGAMISSAGFTTLLPEPDAAYQQFNITVQNHSYGTGIENFYGADAAAYDASVITRPSLVHVFSAGNSGLLASSMGPYAGVPSFANLTGSFKMAKNIITIGHTDSFEVVLSPSSKGPAYDGRVKPELVAFGEDGSSGAAALVSGVSLVMQQSYKELHGVMPSSALVKAILLNSADDTGPKGIDFTSGYGALNAFKAMQGVLNARHFEGSISNNVTDAYILSVPAGTRQLKITLVWNDQPATPNAVKALRNDLDLELSLPSTGETWKPWVLNSFPHVDSLQHLPVRKRDSLNNVEQVTVDDPVAGSYVINVKGFNIPAAAPQPYFIAYQFDTLDKFTWYYPAKTDNIFGGSTNVIRWGSTYNNLAGRLEYSINNGNSWQLISNNVDLAKGFYKWNVPDTFVTALLRMNIPAQDFVSDTFTISKRFNTFVGFNCPDSFLFYWNKIPGVSGFQLYRLGEKYMEPLQITTNTAVILGKQGNPSLYYSVAPLLNNKTGVRSYGFNYTTQGVGCYIKTFLVQLAGNAGLLDLEIGSAYKVSTITWEKLTLNGYVPLSIINNIAGLVYSYTDPSLSYGTNTYRVKITLVNGQIVYSEPATLYYFGNRLYIVYPNPALQYQPVTILSNEPETTLVQVFNSVGQKVYESLLNDLANTLPAGKLSKGFYVLRVIKENKLQASLKLVVL